jgi:hypothetical protein
MTSYKIREKLVLTRAQIGTEGDLLRLREILEGAGTLVEVIKVSCFTSVLTCECARDAGDHRAPPATLRARQRARRASPSSAPVGPSAP